MNIYKNKKMNSKIKSIKTREILDSRGNPTVEVDLVTGLGVFRSSVPSGVSKGKYEAVELRDKDKRYYGKGVRVAVKNINKIIAPRLKGKDVTRQKEIDELMIRLDGTENKSRLGANAIVGISMAVSRAGAGASNLPLWKYIAKISGTKKPVLPTPSILLLEGGLHAGNKLDIQEFMIVPLVSSYKEKLRIGTETYHTLGSILKKRYGENAVNVGYEGGFAAPLRRVEEALDLMMEAIERSGYKNKIKICLDVAASSFYSQGIYKFEGVTFTTEGLLSFYSKLFKKYPIISIEDPFAEEDWKGWEKLNAKCKTQNAKLLIIGDDLLTTNPKRIKEARDKRACNSLLLKVNQIGTVSEAIAAAKLANSYGWKVMVSHRSGETCDDFIADLAVGIGADYIKAGAPARGERAAKYNRLLRIEEEIK